MSYFLGGAQPVDPVGYWIKAHPHADLACLVTLDGTQCLRTACGRYLPKQSAIQGVRGVRLCEGCVAKVKAKIERNKMDARSIAGRNISRR